MQTVFGLAFFMKWGTSSSDTSDSQVEPHKLTKMLRMRLHETY